MSDWWHVAQVSAPALGSAALCIGLRRYLRAVLWTVLLKLLGVEAAERRDIAVRAARLDLRVDRSGRARRRRRPNARLAAPERSCRAVRARGLRM
jgi:hypothetical protein